MTILNSLVVNRDLDGSVVENPSTFRLVLICTVVFIDFLGVTLPANIIPVMIDKSTKGHLVGCESIPEGTAVSIAAFTYAIGMSISPPLMGWLSDRRGRRPLLLASMLGISISYFLQGSARNYWWFAFFRFLTGLSGGGRPVAMAYITDTLTDVKRRTSYFSYINMVPGLCFGLGPAFGGVLAFFSLSAPFYFVSFWACVVFALLYLYLPESLHPSRIRAKKLGSDPGESLLSELVEDSPEIDCRAFSLLYFVSAMTMFLVVVIGLMSPLVLRDFFNLSPLSAGFTYLGDGTLIVLGTLSFIHLVNEVGYTSSFLGASSLFIYGLGCLILPETFHDLFFFLAIKYIFLGASPSLTFAALPVLVVEFSPRHRSGELMGYFTLFQGAGRLVGTITAGLMYDAHPYVPFLTAGVGSLLAGSACSLLYHRVHRNRETLSSSEF